MIITWLFVNIVYAGAWLLIHKLRNAKNKDWRILDNEFEFYEALQKEEKERYWSRMNKETDRFLLHLVITMNLSWVPMFAFGIEDLILTFVILGIGFIIAMIIYIRNNQAIKRQAMK